MKILSLHLRGELNVNSKINSAFEIAKYVITISCLSKKPVTNMELQMILYHLQLFYLKETKNKLFYDEIEVNDYNVRIASIDNLFVCNKQMRIMNLYNCYDISFEKKKLIKPEIHRLVSNNLYKVVS